MSDRQEMKAESWILRGNRRRLRLHLRKHPHLMGPVGSLIELAMAFRPELLPWLLDRGVPADQKDEVGCTPLMSACSGDEVEIVELLLARGANIEALNDDGESALGFAVAWDCTTAVEVLVRHGVNTNCRHDSGPHATQLDYAILKQDKAMVAALRAGGAKTQEELTGVPAWSEGSAEGVVED